MSKIKELDYSNWISIKIVIVGLISTVILAVVFSLGFLIKAPTLSIVFKVIFGVLTLIVAGFTTYMAIARNILSYKGMGVQGMVLDNALSFLKWDGNGKLIDIGCGSGAMSIKAAKKFINCNVIGVDYWGIEWDYDKEQCERNAEIEGVSDRVEFQKGDAANLDFGDEVFDAAISNFVFHEVRSQPDKIALINEAFRVIKPGGLFVFEDVFYSKSNYKDINALVEELSKSVKEIHFVDTRKCSFVPKLLNTPLVLGEMGLIYGIK